MKGDKPAWYDGSSEWCVCRWLWSLISYSWVDAASICLNTCNDLLLLKELFTESHNAKHNNLYTLIFYLVTFWELNYANAIFVPYATDSKTIHHHKHWWQERQLDGCQWFPSGLRWCKHTIWLSSSSLYSTFHIHTFTFAKWCTVCIDNQWYWT